MILSASRRTDIPACYSQWFYNRIKEGYVYVRNPVNPRQVSRVNISPDVVDCIVFWTKNPENMLAGLDNLDGYRYCFLFTITGYGRDIEPFVGDKKKTVIPAFRYLSEKIGASAMTWLYDPVFVTPKYTMEYHIHAFEEIAKELCGCTNHVILSFLTDYRKTVKNMKGTGVIPLSDEDMIYLAGRFREIAERYGMQIQTCVERADLSAAGVQQGACIDKARLEDIIGMPLAGGKDPGQRKECRCFTSIDIGSFDTCSNGCRYCYANSDKKAVDIKSAEFDVNSPILCDSLSEDDRIYERCVRSLVQRQISIV